jgi:hypothetical protein
MREKETELMLKEESMKPNPRGDAELQFITDVLYLDGASNHMIGVCYVLSETKGCSTIFK